MTYQTTSSDDFATRPERVYVQTQTTTAGWIVNYSLALIFLWFGALKFTAYEASAVAPLVMNSPFVGWWHGVLGIDGTAIMLGVFEIATGLLLAARPLNARMGVVGGAMAAITFLVTISFLLTTPGVVQPGTGTPFALSPMPGQFLLKDVVLLCVSGWILSGSLEAVRART